MPEWMADITLGGAVATVAGILIVLGVFQKVRKPVKKVTESIAAFMATWNGVPEVRDESGAFVKAAVPGIPAQLETIRAQVQNSHSSNLRDDMDKIHGIVEALVSKVDEHIEIAKASDDRQDETERIVKECMPKIQRLLGED